MATEWHYSHDGQRHGPVSLGDLKQLLVSGQLQLDDLVWKVAVHSVKLALPDFGKSVMKVAWYVKQFREDVQSGKISVDRLIELIVTPATGVADSETAGSSSWKGNWASHRPRRFRSRSRWRQKNGGRRREERKGGSESGGFGVGG